MPLTSVAGPVRFSRMTLELEDLDALKEAALRKLDISLEQAPAQKPPDRELAQLQAELDQIYRVVVLLQKNELEMGHVAEIWGKMVAICDDVARQLAGLADKSATYRNSYDHILDLRNAAEERRSLHAKP